MYRFLSFEIYAPMASWGDVAVGEVRPIQIQPTRSSIIGMVASALGMPRAIKDDPLSIKNEEALLALNESLGLATACETAGKPLRDYHTAQSPSSKKGQIFRTRRDELNDRDNLNTILSTRDYRCDVLFHIFLWEKGTERTSKLNDIQKALIKPRFPLYLGRRSCPPSLPLNPKLIDAENLISALEHVSAHAKFNEFISGGITINPQDRVLYWESSLDEDPSKISGVKSYQTFTRRDTWVSPLRRQFSVRSEHRAAIHGGLS